MNGRFTCAPVKGGWRIYDTERYEHMGRVYRTLSAAEAALASVAKYRSSIVRFIFTGATS